MNSRLPAAFFALTLVATLFFAGAAWAQSAIPIFVSGKDRNYTLLDDGRAELITVRGPGELRLVSRARFEPREGESVEYSLLVRIDGGEEQRISYSEVTRSRTAMFRDGTLGVPGHLQDHRIQLSRGYHNIEVRAGAGSPEIFFRHLFKAKRERRRSWVGLTPKSGAAPVELIVRETIVTYYRNRPGKPFEVEVIGPTELRIFTRTENTPEMRGRIHYRLQVRRGGEVVNTFQLTSRRSDLATYRSEDALVPGRAAEVIVPVPEGLHRFEIQPLDQNKPTLLTRFMLPTEDLSLTAE